MWMILVTVFKFQVFKHVKQSTPLLETHCADQRCHIAGFLFERVDFAISFTQRAVTVKLTRVCGFHPSRRALSKWTKHGQTPLVIPGHDPPADITVFMDVAVNPGPPWQISNLKVSGKLEHPNLHVSDSTTTYTRNQLLHYRHCQNSWISPLQLQALKVNCIFKYRGKRGGKHRIPVKISQRHDLENENNYATFLSHSSLSKQQYVNFNNLTLVPRNPPISKCSSNDFEFCLLNARSIRNKTVIIKDLVVDKNIDILAITETWLRPSGDEICIGDLCPTGYGFLHVPRIDSVGGGVGLLFKESLRIKTKAEHQFKSFEYMDISLINLQNVRVIIVYRPPPSQSNLLTPGLFFEEFSSFLEQIITSPGNLLLVGDFNFHVEDIDDILAKRFLSLLKSFNLKQCVSEPTHSSGHILDLVITRSEENIVNNVNVFDPVISDHSAIQLQLTLRKPQFMKKTLTFRNLRSLNCDALKTDISSSSLIRDCDNVDVNTLVDKYDKILRQIIDSHAPVKHRTVTLRPKAPWYTSEIDEQKRIRRSLERKWRSSRLESDRNQYKNQCNLVNNLIHNSKSAHYTQLIKDGASDQKTLFKTVSRLLHKNAPICYPSSPDTRILANSFADFFTDKVEKIQQKIAEKDCGQINPLPDTDLCSSEFSNFCSINAENISVVIRRVARKSCDLDPMPAVVLLDCLDVLLPVITKIINLSLETGTMPDPLKVALLTPLLKKPNANHEEFGNFRPISNLSFISKSIEKVVAQQLTKYISDNGLDEPFQSAYKSFHSTETALLMVQNDILRSLDENRSVILVLLDLSAAFDTVDHSILISRLSKRFGLKGNVLTWFKSYLSSRKQFVRIDGCDSTMHELARGVPQGSVLGPLLYSLYTTPLGDLARQHNLHYHFFADDSQLYISFKTKSHDELVSSKSRIEKCIDDINAWMVINKLKLNQDKTELLLIHSKFQPSPPLDHIQIGDEKIMPSSSARNLGVMFHEHFNYEEHINKVCKSSYYHIRNMSTIRKYLNKDCMEIIIHAFISSRLDYCNSLLHGIPKYLLQKLQHIQNTAARTLTLTKKSSHITPVLIDLHWLPVTYRIQYKILLLVYKALNGSAPKYLSELLQLVSSRQHNLRSNAEELLFVPRSKLKTYGDRCFSVLAPKLWNFLPFQIRKSSCVDIFKQSLKTYLFNLFLKDSDFR